jgi:hypothetical protein
MGLPQGASAAAITAHIDSTVIQPTCGRATPMFWLRPQTVNLNGGSTFSTNILNVPSVCQQVANAGMAYAANSNYTCRLTGLSDRIFAMQIRSGVPLYAYQGVYNLQETYNAKIKAGEPGVHLYEVNTALAAKEDKTAEDIAALERENWATWLPSPIPYSVDNNSVPNGKEKEQVYKDAVAAGIIRKNPVSLKWQVLESSDTLDKINSLKPSSFLDGGGNFSYQAAAGALNTLQGTKAGLYAAGNYTAHNLEDKSDPKYTQAVLLDWFIRCPLLVRIAENELNKIKALDDAIVSVNALVAEAKSRDDLIAEFADAMMMGVIEQKTGKIVYVHEFMRESKEENLTKSGAEYCPSAMDDIFVLYKSFLGFSALSDELRTQIKKVTKDRKNGEDAEWNKNPEKGMEIASEFLTNYNSDMITFLFNKLKLLEPDVCVKAQGFYKKFLDTMDDYRKMIMILGMKN